MRDLDAIVAGELYVDLILAGFNGVPRFGAEVFAKDFRREIGGGAAITACGLAKLGSRSAVLGVAGGDAAAWMRKRFERAGVEAGEVRVETVEPTGFTVAATIPEDRMFLSYAGANRVFPEWLTTAAREQRLIRARHVHLAFPPDLMHAAELIEMIRANGCTVSLDVGWHEQWLRDPRALKLAAGLDIFFPSLTEAACMTGESEPEMILSHFRNAGAKCVALKLGAEGAALLWDSKINTIGPCLVRAVDTTGAGDCFDAGFLHAWLAGDGAERCLKVANVCGAVSTEALGGIAGFPTRERVEQELRR